MNLFLSKKHFKLLQSF